MANAITALGLVTLFENFTTGHNIKLVGTTTTGSGTVAWESDVEPATFTVQSQAGQAQVATLTNDIVYTITFPAGTQTIDFDKAQLVDSNDRDKVYVEATLDGGAVQYTGFGEFTLTEFSLSFSPTPTE